MGWSEGMRLTPRAGRRRDAGLPVAQAVVRRNDGVIRCGPRRDSLQILFHKGNTLQEFVARVLPGNEPRCAAERHRFVMTPGALGARRCPCRAPSDAQ